MDYHRHYDILCERAKTRSPLTGYTEKHHIVPRCMGGGDEPENLVTLTAEEHYVAHQLLVKMYPRHEGLAWAAIQMTSHINGNRNNNKIYGWLKRKHSDRCKQRIGNKNGSYGTMWITDGEHNKKIGKSETVPEGWHKGRKIGKKKVNKCLVCGCETNSRRAKYCPGHRLANSTQTKEVHHIDEEKFIDEYSKCGSMNTALKRAGVPVGAVGSYYYKAKKLIAPVSPVTSNH